jgi:hypothetical protein
MKAIEYCFVMQNKNILKYSLLLMHIKTSWLLGGLDGP